MNCFDIALQVEDISSNEEDLVLLTMMNEDIYDGIDILAKYGEQVGFNSSEFFAACEEAFVNAAPDAIQALACQNIYDVKDFTSFVIGFSYARVYFQLF